MMVTPCSHLRRRWRLVCSVATLTIVLIVGAILLVRHAKAGAIRDLMKTIEVAEGETCFEDLSAAAVRVRQWNQEQVAARRVLAELRCDSPYFVKTLYVLGELGYRDPEVDQVLRKIQDSSQCTSAQHADAKGILEELQRGSEPPGMSP